MNVSLSARELCKVALRGGLRVEGRGAAGALGRRLRVSLPQLKRRAMLSARGGGGGELASGCSRYWTSGCAALPGLLGCCRCFKAPRARSPQLLARAWLHNDALVT